jgi:hypothetical protein
MWDPYPVISPHFIYMASPDEIRDRLPEADQAEEDAEAKRQRIEDAATAREEEQQYQGDLDEKKQEADAAEERIDNPEA